MMKANDRTCYRHVIVSHFSCVAVILHFFHTFPSVFTSNSTMDAIKPAQPSLRMTLSRRAKRKQMYESVN